MSRVLKNYNSIPADHRPFFSVICPCYNSKPDNIDLLIQTISTQDFPKEDIELIFTDDCSTDTSYFTVIDKYKDDLKEAYGKQLEESKDKIYLTEKIEEADDVIDVE